MGFHSFSFQSFLGFLKRIEVIAEEVLEVPLGGRCQRAFEADEEGLIFGFGEFA